MSRSQIPPAQARFQTDPDFRAALRRLALREGVWEQIVKVFRQREAEDGLTQVEWASRCKKTPAQINRLIARPSNLTLDTIADALSALDGYLQVDFVDAKPQMIVSNCEFIDSGPARHTLPAVRTLGLAKPRTDSFTFDVEPT